jgi:hypothetical protein
VARYVAWVDGQGCLDTECQAVGNPTWDTRAIYCSTRCFLADGHQGAPMMVNWRASGDDSHELLWGLEPDACEHCASCDAKVLQGINCQDCADAEVQMDDS